MAYAVLIHRSDSRYEDIPSEVYQFPDQYLQRAKECEGDWIVYYEPTKVKNTKGYFAVARIQKIIDDPNDKKLHFAMIEPGSYLDFGEPIPFRERGTVIESGLLNEMGIVSAGRATWAVRPLSAEDFFRIVKRGLCMEEDLLTRSDKLKLAIDTVEENQEHSRLYRRNRVSQLLNRTVRDLNFRSTVLRAYDSRCAITGLKLINGGGRAEVEAAHIKPVSNDGPDIVSNGIALSGTVHWMFDRGLIGLTDEFEIMISRQINDRTAVESMINSTGVLLKPTRDTDWPRENFMKWHRDNCFKH